MSLVREHIIFEKFTEDSDPVHDMDIGVLYKIILHISKQFYNSTFKEFLKRNNIKSININDHLYKHRYNPNYKFIGTKGSLKKLLKNYFYYLLPIENCGTFKKLNEKFTEDSDPIHDMGIGLRRDFQDEVEMEQFIFVNLLRILETDKIPEDIIMSNMYCLRSKYLNKIQNYVETYFTINGEKPPSYISYGIVMNRLRDLGYRVSKPGRYVKGKRINEKFTEDSDPVSDMNIGIKRLMKRDIEKMEGMTGGDMSGYFFNDFKHYEESVIIYRAILKFVLRKTKKQLKQLINEEIKKVGIAYNWKLSIWVIKHLIKERYGIEI
jgi:hypothetical protein